MRKFQLLLVAIISIYLITSCGNSGKKNITFEKKEFVFDGKYRLLIYTDGLHEAINNKREQYGGARVKRDLKKYAKKSPQQYLDNMVRDLQKFTGSKNFQDDLTLVVMDINL